MAVGYRTVLRAYPSTESFERLTSVYLEWVTKKKKFEQVPAPGETTQNGDGATLEFHQIKIDDLRSAGCRWVLTEQWSPPRWYKNTATDRTGRTIVTIAYSDGAIWLWVDVQPPTLEYQDSSGRSRVELQECGTPTFVRDMLARVDMFDGIENPVADVQQIATRSHVEQLLESLRDSERRGAIYLTAPPAGVGVKEWAETTAQIVGKIEGMGSAYVLKRDAQNMFNDVAGTGHRIPSGAMRTFLSGVELTNTRDALRHKLLHASTIAESDKWRLRRIVRNAQVSRIPDIGLPDILLELNAAFEQEKKRLLRERQQMAARQITHARVDADTQELLQRINELERLRQEMEDLFTQAADEALDYQRKWEAELEARKETAEESDLYYLELTEIRTKRQHDLHEINRLRNELAAFGREGYAAAFEQVEELPDLERPETFADLVKAMNSLSGVRYFGDPNDAEELDEKSDLGEAAVGKAWDALITFDAYVNAREGGTFDGSLRQYVNNSDHGQLMLVRDAKWGESQTVRTNTRMATQREISGLPPEIAENGTKMLVAHVPLATRRGGSPRLYFDDTYAAAGYVVVGYIGTHLENTLTD